nr:MAG TPA_asm: hypothetical protein [Caudoviricetes sp.]
MWSCRSGSGSIFRLRAVHGRLPLLIIMVCLLRRGVSLSLRRIVVRL